MTKKISLGKSLGIAGKDTVAIALIAWGLNAVQNGDFILGGLCIAVGFTLLAIQQYIT